MPTTLAEVTELARALPRGERERLVVALADSLADGDEVGFRPSTVSSLAAQLAAAEVEHRQGRSIGSAEVRRRLQRIREGRGA